MMAFDKVGPNVFCIGESEFMNKFSRLVVPTKDKTSWKISNIHPSIPTLRIQRPLIELYGKFSFLEN